MKRTLLATASIGMLLTLTACPAEKESAGAKRESAATQQLMDQASTAVGMPGVRNFTEKRMLKMLYELRDNAALVTYSYYVDFNGNKHEICPETSIGYGIPFSAQYTAPSVDQYKGNGGTVTIMQPEPNGLYMPDSTTATWVMCLDPIKGEPYPVYVEPMVIVSTQPFS